jgi:hypothetical protein
MASFKSKEYEQGWNAAFDAIADYVEEEVCIITASMIRRMKHEDWRFKEEVQSDTESSDTRPLEEQ